MALSWGPTHLQKLMLMGLLGLLTPEASGVGGIVPLEASILGDWGQQLLGLWGVLIHRGPCKEGRWRLELYSP